jgi:general secretion pathway protein D
VTLNALKTSSVADTLASPRIRARNHEKAKILIGQRVPVITQSALGIATNSTGVAQTSSVQYLEVGLTLEAEPTIHRNGDVAIKLSLEVSSIIGEVKIGQTQAYKIGTRTANTLLQLRDGETQILAGLIQDSDTKSANNIPGLGDLPLIGRLFGSHSTGRDKTEIVLAVTPRVIRAQRRPSSETTEFWYGTESGTRSTPIGGVTVEGLGGAAARQAGYSAPAAPAPRTTIVQSSMQAAPQAPAPTPAAAAPAATPPADSAPAPAAGGDAGAAPIARQAAPAGADAPATSAPAASTAATPTLTWEGPTQVKVGDEFDVTLNLDTGGPVTQLRGQVRYDANALELTSAASGGVLGSVDSKVETPRGVALIDAMATADAPISGSGVLLTLHFKALVARPSSTVSARVAATGGKGGAGIPTAPPLNIAIKP